MADDGDFEVVKTADNPTNDFEVVKPVSNDFEVVSPNDFQISGASIRKKSSSLGSFGRSAARNVAPTAAFLAAAPKGARAGALIAAAIPGVGETGIAELVGGGIGAIVLGGLAAWGAHKAQSSLADTVAPDSLFGSQSETEDEQEHPIASELGSLAVLGKPKPLNIVRAARTLITSDGRKAVVDFTRSAATKDGLSEWKAATDPKTQSKVFNVLQVAQSGGANAMFNVYDQIQSGHFSGTDLLRSAAEGALFNEPWIHAKNPAAGEFEKSKQTLESEDKNATNPEQQRSSVSTERAGVDEVGKKGSETGVGDSVQGAEGEPAQAEGGKSTPETVVQAVQRVSSLTPADFLKTFKGGGMTNLSFDLGEKVKTIEEVQAITEARDKAVDDMRRAMKVANSDPTPENIDTANAIAAKPQFFNEILQKVPDELKASALPKPTEIQTSQPSKEVTPPPGAASEAWYVTEQKNLANSVVPEVQDKIEQLALQRKTAAETSKELGIEVNQVRAVRNSRKIPSMDQREEFEAWVQSKQPQQEPISAAVRSKTGEIFTGNSHDRIHAENPKLKGGEEGFVMADKTFINRDEAKSKFGKTNSHEFAFGKDVKQVYIEAKKNGYPSERAFAKDFVKNRDASVKESEDEFLRRRVCSETVPVRKAVPSE